MALFGFLGGKKNVINLKQVQYLLANDPLKIVRLEHSQANKKLIVKGLENIFQSPQGPATFDTLQEFLEKVAPKKDLSTDQDGARIFLLKTMERIRS